MDRAAIFNSEGNSVWATSAGFTVSPQEMQAVVAAYKDPGTDGVKQVQSSGLHVAGERFVVLKADDRSIYGKKVSTHPESWMVGSAGWGLADVCFGDTGPRRRGDCEDDTGDPRHALPRERAAGRGGEYGGAAG